MPGRNPTGDRERIRRLLSACELYHEALDMAFAQLIVSTSNVYDPPELFYPSHSPMWAKMIAAHTVYENVKQEILADEAGKQ